jgi:hypothetical protein
MGILLGIEAAESVPVFFKFKWKGRDVTTNGSAYAGQLFTRPCSVRTTELPSGGHFILLNFAAMRTLQLNIPHPRR